MSLENLLQSIVSFFEEQHIRYRLIGAFALQVYGYIRATRDIDFIICRSDQQKVINFLESLGFETINKSDGYSNHLHPIDSMRIDFIYIDETTAQKIFSEGKSATIFQNVKIKAVSPEHLIALKLFSIKNAPGRRLRELADIKELIKVTKIEKERVIDLFKKYELLEFINEVYDEQ